MSAIRTNRANTRDGRFIAPYTRWVSRKACSLLCEGQHSANLCKFSRIFGIQSSEESEEVKFRTSTEDESMVQYTTIPVQFQYLMIDYLVLQPRI